MPKSAGRFGGDPSFVANSERDSAVLAKVGRTLLVADASISVEDEICFGSDVGRQINACELFLIY